VCCIPAVHICRWPRRAGIATPLAHTACQCCRALRLTERSALPGARGGGTHRQRGVGRRYGPGGRRLQRSAGPASCAGGLHCGALGVQSPGRVAGSAAAVCQLCTAFLLSRRGPTSPLALAGASRLNMALGAPPSACHPAVCWLGVLGALRPCARPLPTEDVPHSL